MKKSHTMEKEMEATVRLALRLHTGDKCEGLHQKSRAHTDGI